MAMTDQTQTPARTDDQGESGSTGESVSQSTGRRGLPYISGLDGIRAIAVLAVMFYHADLAWMPGGFLGVDIFFVLSGFLITSLVLTELERTNRLDFKQFYIRRARRLLPAVLVLLAVVAVIGAFLATDAAAGLRRDIPASLIYVTNWAYVFADESYFEAIGRPPLLQHLWSLAVEEQFYLIWPAVAFMAFRRGQKLANVTGRDVVRHWAMIGAFVSTALMIVMSLMGGYPDPNDGSRVYFGTDGHAMGLLVGAALATIWLPQAMRKVSYAASGIVNLVGFGSLLLVIWIMTNTHSDSAWLYRGGFLVFAVIVAVMIAAVTHPSSRIGAILGKQPLRYIGQRSYGLYLWHWPIFLILRPGLDVPIEGYWNLALRFGVTFAAAELSYRYIEMPVRRGDVKRKWQAYRAQPTEAREQATKKFVAITSVTLIVIGLSAFRIATIPEDDADYLDGATEISALDDQPAVKEPKAGDPTLSETVTAPSPSTTRPGVLMVGESVMLGARRGLQSEIGRASVDASVGRQAVDVLDRIRTLKAAGALRDTVILHTGSNGYVERNELQAMLNELSPAKRLVVVNVSVPRIWQDANNELIADLVETTPNAVLADWHGVATADSDLMVKDGVHLTTRGVESYAQTIKSAMKAIKIAQDSAGSTANSDEPVDIA